MSHLSAKARIQEAAVSSWGGERKFDKLASLKPAPLSAPLRSHDHIRLVLLHPAEQPQRVQDSASRRSPAQIRCTVFQGRLRELSCLGRPMFAALSYCWGSSAKSYSILCNNKSVKITENLFHAMNWVRLATRPRFIWIDSLCIDQDNAKEKSQQVSRIGLIFSQAHVISYIGGNTDVTHAQTCLAVVRRLAAIADHLSDDKYTRDDLIRLPPKLYNTDRPTTLGNWQSVPWARVVNLLHEEYFTRLWVFQEIRLARSHTCQWGQHSCSIRQLNEAARMIILAENETIPRFTLGGYHTSLATEARLNIQIMAQDPFAFDQFNQHHSSDLRLVTLCARFGCKDPRDRIYGLSSMFEGNDVYPVDYSSSIAKVFAKFTFHILSTNAQAFLVDAIAEHELHRSAYRDPDGYAQEVGWTWSSKALPSWCPDYGIGGQIGLRPFSWRLRRLHETERPNTRLMPQIFPETATSLRANVIECATIAACSDQRRSDSSFTKFLLKAGHLALRLRNQLPAKEICVGFLDALRAGSPFAIDVHQEHPYESTPTLHAYHRTLSLLGQYYLEKFVPCLLTLCRDSTTRKPRFSKNQIKTFMEEMDQCLKLESQIPRRCYVTTADSPVGARFGCGPDGLRVGDKIFVIFGLRNPVVLRQIGKERCFKYIGSSHLKGLMEGEAIGLDSKEEQIILV